ncbi:hypothetical protein HK101_009608 [Irineochytrium annulatum]|nr:hypothetical protein HK101_009608 [Irineochytrium annulatum]
MDDDAPQHFEAGAETSLAPRCCHRCLRPVNDLHVLAGDKPFHSACFTCFKCRNAFKEGVFFEAEGEFFCEIDHALLFGELDGKLYCPVDYAALQMRICKGCGEPIGVERSVENLKAGTHFHPQCFVCKRCRRPFADGVFWEFEGGFYCADDYARAVGSVCAFCFKASRGSSIEVFGRQWCEDHFLCNGCHADMRSKKFVSWDQKVFCKKCYESLPRKVREKLHAYCELEKKQPMGIQLPKLPKMKN